ncbi:MAG: hypothetical protein JJLCMIEE_01771 [Acidimicrobiales bacterium]|nr:MAG: DUF559 domain-containing protein [Actinomycetota bacterium]MBV6508705.1 hypothetical protein [Acidimicrobiales bacterium]RIK08138.1 MAG: hypothetical protein DCC48_01820 [Acidobacteriota bacterium]
MVNPLDARIGSLADRQHGVFSRNQAIGLGATVKMIRHRVSCGRWERVSRGVLRLVGAQDSWYQRVLIAICASEMAGVASHRTAAAIHDLEGFTKGLVELSLPYQRRLELPDVVIHRTRRLDNDDITVVEGVPVTTVARTLIDLGAVTHPDRVEESIDSALRDELTSLPLLSWRRENLSRQGRNGVGVIRPLIYERQGVPVDSRYERRLIRACVKAGLPAPVPQYEVRDGGILVAKADLAWPAHRIIAEVDGHRGHATRKEREHDSLRENRLKELGWVVYRFTTDQVWTHLPTCVATLARAIRRAS